MKSRKSNLTFHIKKQTIRNKKYFVYHKKEYPFDFDLLVKNCNYFYDNQNEFQNVQHIELINEKEEHINLSEESIQAFIQSSQNEECTISESSVIALQYLAHKFGFTELIQITDQFINENSKDLVFQKLLFQNFDNNEKLNENTFFDTSKEEIFISNHLNDYIQKDEMLSLSIPLLYRILKRYTNDEHKQDKKLKISEVTDFLFKCLDKYGKSASVLFSLVDFNHEKIDVLNRLIRNHSDIFDFNMINLTLTKTATELTSEVTKQKEEYSMLFSQMKDTFNQQLSELVKTREEVKEQKIKDDIENKKRIQSFIFSIDKIKSDVDNKMKSIEDKFERICKKQDEFIENSGVRKYHQMILHAITVGQFNQFDDQLKDHFILELYKNNWTNLSHEEINKKKSILKSVIDVLSGNDNIQVFKVLKGNNNEELKINNRRIEKLYQQNLLYSRLVECINCFGVFQVEVKYSCQQFQQIMSLLVDINNKNKKKMKISLILNRKENFEKCKITRICKVGRKLKVISDKLFCFEGDTDINYLEIHSNNLKQNDNDNFIIANTFENCTTLNELFITSSISEIGNSAFYGCSSIKQVTFELPSTLKQIGDYSFSGCSSLASITIPSSVTSIGNYSFSGCSSLASITIPTSVTSIGNYSFSGCSSLTSITIPSSVKKVGEFCFDGCSKLDYLTIDPFHTQIESTSFNNCQPIKHFSLSKPEENEKSKTNESFLFSSGITCVLNKLNILSSSEFSNHISNFKEVQFEIQYPSSNFSNIYQSVINLKQKNSGKIKIKIFYTGTKVDDKHFNKNEDINYLRFDSKIKEIQNKEGKYESGPFAKCTSLIEVFIPSSVEKIDNYTFHGCSSLKKLTFELPSSLKQIGNGVFASCSSLTQISIPSSVTSIGECAFDNCSSLTEISIPSSVTSIEQCAFQGCRSLTQISIPSSITSIKRCTFYSCYELTQISIPSSVTSIGPNAFDTCLALTKISIPSSVTSIGYGAFSSCHKLTQISIPSSINVSELGINSNTSITRI